MKNPFPQTITDNISGAEVKNEQHAAWSQGFDAGRMGLSSSDLGILMTAMSCLPIGQVDILTWRHIHSKLLTAMME